MWTNQFIYSSAYREKWIRKQSEGCVFPHRHFWKGWVLQSVLFYEQKQQCVEKGPSCKSLWSQWSSLGADGEIVICNSCYDPSSTYTHIDSLEIPIHILEALLKGFQYCKFPCSPNGCEAFHFSGPGMAPYHGGQMLPGWGCGILIAPSWALGYPPGESWGNYFARLEPQMDD